MPLPVGTIPVTGPFIDTSGSLPPATAALRDNHAISLRGGKLQRVNAGADGWEDVPGHVVSLARTINRLYAGLIWYNSTGRYFDGL